MSDQECVFDHLEEPGGPSPPIVPDQIEALITKHPEVLQAVVVVDRTLGEERLVAYVVAASSRLRPDELQAHLADTLPPDLRPQDIVVLPRLPVGPDGELDRTALPAPHFHVLNRDCGPASRSLPDNPDRARTPRHGTNGVVRSAEPPLEPIHRPIERQAERRPTAIAAVFEGASLDYGELNCRSNRLARHLQSLGVGPDVCVGVLMERSLDLPVALLAVLKAGGAFVPLDPEYPRDRLAYMLADSAAPWC